MKPIIVSSILSSPIIFLLTLGTSAFVSLTLSVKIAEKVKESKENPGNLMIDDFNVFKYYLKGFKIFFYGLGVLAPFIIITLLLFLIFFIGISFLQRNNDLAYLVIILSVVFYVSVFFLLTLANVFRYYFIYLYDDLAGFREIVKRVYITFFRNILTSIFVVLISILLVIILNFLSPFIFLCSLTFLAALPNLVLDIIVLSYIGSKSIEERI